jgi:hypothetical protein
MYLVTDGSSSTALFGEVAGGGHAYPWRYASTDPSGNLYTTFSYDAGIRGVFLNNLAVDASVLADIVARAPTVKAAFAAHPRSQYFQVFSAQIGANDMPTVATLSTWITNVQNYLSGIRSDNPNAILVQMTLLSRFDWGQTDWLATNVAIRQMGAAGFSDYVCDVAADPIIGPYSFNSNTTYCVDGIHMTEAGYDRYTAIYKALLDSLIPRSIRTKSRL